MTRTQISLTEEQHRFLTELSRQTGESISAIIRKVIERMRSQRETPNGRALKLLGAFRADRSDVSVRHDEVLWGADQADGEDRS